MDPKYYPKITEEQVLLLNRVIRQVGENADFLNDPSCPYSPMIKDFITKRAAPIDAPSVDLFGDDVVDGVEKQVMKLMNDLEAFAQQLSNADQSEKLQYFKTKTTLLEKLLTQLERAANLKQINEFRSLVIQFMDEVLDKDQITNFMKRIDGVLTNGR